MFELQIPYSFILIVESLTIRLLEEKTT